MAKAAKRLGVLSRTRRLNTTNDWINPAAVVGLPLQKDNFGGLGSILCSSFSYGKSMKANELSPGQFFDYLGMTCVCDANDLGGQPVRFGYWDCGTYRLRYCGAFCEVSALPFLNWDEAIKKESATMKICGVRLTRQGTSLVVDVETVNGWIEVIREQDDGTTPISHICEASGLVRANRDACEQSSMDDLTASGGIRASF